MVLFIMDVVSAKIEKETKEKMKKLSYINWSEVIRETLKARIEEEESRGRSLDRGLIIEGVKIAVSVRKTVKDWNSTEEIRRWRARTD